VSGVSDHTLSSLRFSRSATPCSNLPIDDRFYHFTYYEMISLCLVVLSSSAFLCNPFVVLEGFNQASKKAPPIQDYFTNVVGPKTLRKDICCFSAAEDLMEMDVVIFSEVGDLTKRQLGAVQEDGRITSLCVWTTEPAFGESLEFLVDEHDLFPGFQPDQIVIHAIVPQNALSYGSRQVGGGMGPGNPHGEESELLYYVDRSILDDVAFIVNPELEIFW
jgi:hypothetical protein